MRYKQCVDCGEPKIGWSKQRRPRCFPCGLAHRKHHGTRKQYDKCATCGKPKTGRKRLSERCLPCSQKHRHIGCIKHTRPEVYRMRDLVGSHVRNAMKNNKQGQPCFQHLPYTIQEMMAHLEKQFDDKMTWENQGSYWHLDHIVPQILLPYDSYDHPNFLKCWDLRNLQPLEALANCRKHKKLTEEGKALMEIL